MRILKFVGGRRSRQAALCWLAALVVTLGAGAHDKRHQPVPAPVISGTPPASDLAGQAYSFTPTATGPAGYTLTFSISGRPAWATFNAGTGQLAGTPTAVSVGTYSNIVISVSDGVTSASLAAFTITVNQISNGSATVTWTPPTQNSDGTVLTNLAGYRIYYGNAANSLTQRVDLANAGLTAYTVDNLSAATWYFGVTAYTTSGAESALSNLGSKTIP
jgi:Putative Ig domain